MICVCICVYVLLCVIICPFHVPCTICKYQGLLITILNYIAALLTLSSKDFISHLLTMHSDDMVICSLNVRDLSNNTKRRETFLWLKTKKNLTFCKRCIAPMRQNLIGILNGDIQLFLQPSQALEQALLCSVQQQFSISNSETFCRPRRRSNLVINAVSVKKARKLFGTSFGNFLSLNPFGMKLLVIGWKTALAFLRKNSLFRHT